MYEHTNTLHDTTILQQNVVGQAIIKLGALNAERNAHYLINTTDVFCGNFKVAELFFKLKYEVTE